MLKIDNIFRKLPIVKYVDVFKDVEYFTRVIANVFFIVNRLFLKHV